MSMKNQMPLYKLGLLIAGLALVTACASTGPSDAALSGDPSAMWEDGGEDVASGEKLVKNGENQLLEGRKQVREGEAMIARGSQGTLNARQDYQDAAKFTGKASTPDELAKEAKRLKSIGDQWEDAIDDIRDGNKLVTKGNRTIDRGQSEIRVGRALIEAGSTMMRNSQRLRLGEELLPEDQGAAR